MDELVSILIPNYNSEKYIKKTINSAVRQTYSNIEIIVVDNMSTDNSWDIIKNCAAKDERIKIYQNKKNIGPVKNWKRCLDKANGIYAKFLWSDDQISKEFVEKTVKYLYQPNIAFAFTGVEHFNEITSETKRLYNLGRSGIRPIKEYIERQLLGVGYPVSPCCGIFRLDDLRKNLMINVPNKINSDFSMHAIGNDALIYLLTANDYTHFAYVNETISFFRAHTNSITTFTESARLSLLYMLAKAFFVENYYNDKKIIKQFNTNLFYFLIRYKNNELKIKKIADFYIKNKIYSIDYIYFIKKIINKTIKSVKNI